mgnify:CR=1 FL=1|tara:strand:- start:792 stop:938 length:147 start_codon:yes stop_codon:yes gene_type:complete
MVFPLKINESFGSANLKREIETIVFLLAELNSTLDFYYENAKEKVPSD